MDAEKIKMAMVEGINSGRLPEPPVKMYIDKGDRSDCFMEDLGLGGSKPYSPWGKGDIYRIYRKIKYDYRKKCLRQFLMTFASKIFHISRQRQGRKDR